MGSRATLAAVALTIAAFAPAPAAGATQVRLFHDSFSSAYRSPAGAVPTGTKVRLRLRVTGPKAKSVLLRIADRRLKMRRSGSFWTVTYRTPAKPSLVSYSFRVQTARGVYWYGDYDSGTDIHKGGTGKTTRQPFDSFHLTVYDRAFTTPAWLQGAVVYEIFADRFRNGDPSNDYCRAGSSAGCPTFYGDVPAILHPIWNEAVEDSRATGVARLTRRGQGYAPDAPLIGEDTAGPVDASPYLLGTELDGVMNYRFRDIALGFVRPTNWTDSSGTIPALRPREAAHALQAVLEDYPRQAAAVSFNLLDSHDTNRALFVLTEPGKSGFGDPYNRAPYPWADASGRRQDLRPTGDRDALVLLAARRGAAFASGTAHRIRGHAVHECRHLCLRACCATPEARRRRSQQGRPRRDGCDSDPRALSQRRPPERADGREVRRGRRAAPRDRDRPQRPRPRRNFLAANGVEASVVGRPLDESDLIQRAKRGETHAYEELVHAYQGIAFRTAYVIARNAADAEDAAQDGFVKAWRALGRFREGAPFRPWLLRIVANEARNRRRSGGRRAHLALRAATEESSGRAACRRER